MTLCPYALSSIEGETHSFESQERARLSYEVFQVFPESNSLSSIQLKTEIVETEEMLKGSAQSLLMFRV